MNADEQMRKRDSKLVLISWKLYKITI